MTDPSRETIYLTGFMAAGKSTLGRLLAERLKRPFVDLDDEIVNDLGLDIPQIFLKHGESFFRDRESRVLRRLSRERPNAVIACGGGAVLSAPNREILKRGLWCFLDVMPAVLATRLARQNAQRPLIADEDSWRVLYRQRLPWYRLAPIRVAVGNDAPQMVVDRLRRRLLRR